MFSNSLRMSATKAIHKQCQGIWGSCFGRLLRSQLLFPLAQECANHHPNCRKPRPGSGGKSTFPCQLERCPVIFFFKEGNDIFFFSYFIYLWLHWVFIAMHRLSCPKACGIFPDQGSNPGPCISRQILNHCTTRGVQPCHFYVSELYLQFLRIRKGGYWRGQHLSLSFYVVITSNCRVYFSKNFFDVDHFWSLYWICYNTASVLCFGYLATSHVGS